MAELVLVTSNLNKKREIEALLKTPVRTVAVDLPELQGSREEIAAAKCQLAAETVWRTSPCAAVLTEDTALCFDAMDGLPGPYIKWFLQSLGPAGLRRMLTGFACFAATAVTTIAYMSPGSRKPVLYVGMTRGEIVEPRGSTAFGWDCVFQPNGALQTYAEMSSGEKNALSHRAKAVRALYDGLNK